MLRSIRELEQFRVKTADGFACGRFKEIYFDDREWRVTHLVLFIEPSVAGQKQVLVDPGQVARVVELSASIELGLSFDQLGQLPLASSILPVCKQYAALAYSSSALGKRSVAQSANPHLRSLRAVLQYQLETAGESGGRLTDFLYDETSSQIRYLGIEQQIEGKTLRFHILPQAVERITWSTQRIVLKELQPVAASSGDGHEAGILWAGMAAA